MDLWLLMIKWLAQVKILRRPLIVRPPDADHQRIAEGWCDQKVYRLLIVRSDFVFCEGPDNLPGGPKVGEVICSKPILNVIQATPAAHLPLERPQGFTILILIFVKKQSEIAYRTAKNFPLVRREEPPPRGVAASCPAFHFCLTKKSATVLLVDEQIPFRGVEMFNAWPN